MATRTIKFDDFDQSEPAETVTFGLHENTYEIDLSAANKKELEELLQQYIDVARKKSGRSSPATSSGPTPAEIKAWADSEGIEYNKRGRLPLSLIDAYKKAH